MRALLLVGGLAVVIAGCGGDPYAERREALLDEAPTPAATATVDGTDNALPARAPAARALELPEGGAPTASAAMRAFALRFANWSWKDIERQQRELAAMATGPLADRLLRAAERTPAADSTTRPSSRGTVQVVDLRGGGRGVVVTRERTYSDGRPDLGGERWIVYLARATQTDDGWRISRWEPQP